MIVERFEDMCVLARLAGIHVCAMAPKMIEQSFGLTQIRGALDVAAVALTVFCCQGTNGVDRHCLPPASQRTSDGGHVAEEADDPDESASVINLDDVGSAHSRRSIGIHQFPPVAGEVVMGVDTRRATERVAGVVREHDVGHRCDAIVAGTLEGRVDEGAVDVPDRCNEFGASGRIGFAVCDQVGVDGVGEVGGCVGDVCHGSTMR